MNSVIYNFTIWQHRAKSAGLMWWNNRHISQMNDAEIQCAFSDLAKFYGIHYVWGDQ